jgi:hypothetical protein
MYLQKDYLAIIGFRYRTMVRLMFQVHTDGD